MNTYIAHILPIATGLFAGMVIGLGFGYVQNAIQRRQGLALPKNPAMVPGSMRRVAYFMMVLALVQLVCPLLFANGIQWWVCGGIVVGYGFVLFSQLRQRLATVRGR